MTTSPTSGATTDARSTARRPRPTWRQGVGLVLVALLGLLHVSSVSGPPAEAGTDSAPMVVLVLDAVLGVVAVVAAVVAWRTGRRAVLRIAAGSVSIAALTAVPAFVADVPAGLKAAVALVVLLTLAAVVLVLSPARGER